jgi:hypothetical protein
MNAIQTENGYQPPTAEVLSLYHKYRSLSLDPQIKKRPVLCGKYYQRAEHYLALVSKLNATLPVAPLSAQRSASVKT